MSRPIGVCMMALIQVRLLRFLASGPVFAGAFLAASAGLATRPCVAAEPLMELNVEAAAKTVERDTKGDKTITRKRLEIRVESRSRQALDGLALHWKLIGRDIKSRKLILLKKGVEKLTLGPREEELVKTPVAVLEETKDKVVGNKGKKGSRVIKGTGQEFGGYWVEVVDADGKVVGADYTVGMKEYGARF